jgi:hypothetical protein
MAGEILILRDDGTLAELRETPYDSEDLLQALLADHPNLLAGTQMNAASPRRWLLVAREMRVVGEDGTDRGSLDHLFLDQDGVPTLVEVKRSENTQIRREVVGQMLDYAANASWSIDEMRRKFEATCANQGCEPDQKLGEFLGGSTGVDDFWQTVKTNVQAGRVRLIFVADEIPNGLRRIIEFLNGQMDPAEVLGIEVKQHVGPGMKALVPLLVGQTNTSQRVKSVRAPSARKWDEESFFNDLQDKEPTAVPVARRIFDWARDRVTEIVWGTGTQSGSFVPLLRRDGVEHRLFAVYSYGSFEAFFQYHRTRPPFDSEALRKELLDRLNAVPGVSLPEDGISRRPSFRLASILTDDRVEKLLSVYDWFLQKIQE